MAFFTKGCVSCALPVGLSLTRRDKAVVEFDYGLDLGACMGPATEPPDPPGGVPQFPRVLRAATAADLQRSAENEGLAEQAMRAFEALMAREGMAIKPLLAHYTIGRERLLLVFGAPEHVDARKVASKLQWDLKTSVEVRHVGVRDEAAVVGGIGSCGRPLCCATWQRRFPAVSVRMARAQEMSLNPMAVNGCCGRLKCCLQYEYDTYLDAATGLPDDGTVVRWENMEGVVVGRDILRRRLLVRTRELGLRHVEANAVEIVAAAVTAAKETEHDDSSGEWSEPSPARET